MTVLEQLFLNNFFKMHFIKESFITLCSFCLGIFICLIYLLFDSNDYGYIVLIFVIYAACSVLILRVLYSQNDFQVAIRGYFLGFMLGFGIVISLSTSSYTLFGWYVVVLTFFHWSEYFATSVTNPKNLNLDSYLLDHSKEYHLAALASFIEYSIESYFLPEFKLPNVITYIGLIMVIGGEVLRKGAMWKAGTNFNHYVRYRREEGHVLVTSGIYSLFRHPSYVGWFYWSIGTQVMICNPICAILYAICAWKFFDERISSKEITLLNFFGEQYLEYQSRVPVGIPFIRGYILKE